MLLRVNFELFMLWIILTFILVALHQRRARPYVTSKELPIWHSIFRLANFPAPSRYLLLLMVLRPSRATYPPLGERGRTEALHRSPCVNTSWLTPRTAHLSGSTASRSSASTPSSLP